MIYPLLRLILLLAGLILVQLALPASQPTTAQHGHRAAVADAFERWSEGTGTPFDLLDEQTTWTILGPTPTAQTYTLQQLRDDVLTPFQARLATPLSPRVHAIHADGDTVIVLFEAKAQLKNGLPYANSYAWFFRFHEGRVRNVTAVLDLSTFDRAMADPG